MPSEEEILRRRWEERGHALDRMREALTEEATLRRKAEALAQDRMDWIQEAAPVMLERLERAERAEALVEQHEQTVAGLREAIYDPGPHPAWHYATMARHRAEWVTLWRAIDAALAVPEGDTDE